MKLSLVAKWMLVIGVGAAVAAGTTGFHYWNQRNELVHAEILKHFQKFAPDLQLVGRTRLNGLNGVTLRDVEIRDRSTDQALFRARAITIDVDSQALLDRQKVEIRSIEVDSADVLVVREDDGRWNWQQYFQKPQEVASASVPRIDIRQLRVQLHLRHGPGIPSARLLVAGSRLQAVPTSAHGYDLDASVDLPGTGSLNLAGQYNVATGKWDMGGRLRDVAADQNLLRMAGNTDPEIQRQLNEVDTKLRQLLPPPRTADSRSESALLIGSDISRAPRFQGRFDVDFDVSRESAGANPEFRLMVAIRDGSLSVPGIPVALTDVEAVFFRDHEHVRLRVDQARQGDAELSGDFSMTPNPNVPPSAHFEVTRFPFGSQFRPLFPLNAQSFFDKFQPNVLVSGTGRIVRQSDGRWLAQDVQAIIEDGQIIHHKFLYPLTNISASIRQRPVAETNGIVVLDVVDASGMLGDRPWSAQGWWKNPGPETESRFRAQIADVPLDDRFRAALLLKGRQVIESLDLIGTTTGTLDSYRPPGLHQPTITHIDADLTNASLQFERFPYRIDRLSGHVIFDSRDARWTFEDLRGHHDNAVITGSGQFVGNPGPEPTVPGQLNLTVHGERVALNGDLYNALAEPHRHLWDLLNAEGFCNVTSEISWTAVPGQKADVYFPAAAPITIYDGRIRPRPFPYEMDIKEAVVSLDAQDQSDSGVQFCRIHSVQASHDDAPISTTGWAEVRPDGHWQVHLSDLTAQQLPPDDELRAALPDSWRDTLARLHQRGRLSLEPSAIDFKGISESDANMTAAWALAVRLHDCVFNVGVDVENVNGVVASEGTWDGAHLKSKGNISLETADVHKLSLTRVQGPYSIENSEVILGSRDVLTSKERQHVRREQRLRAEAYEGTLFLDTLINTQGQGSYFMFAELQKALLQSYARQHIPNAGQMKGVVTSWLALQGNGGSAAEIRGRGQMEISPAALYELPVVLEMMRSLSQPQLGFNVRDRTAFDYALMTFEVKNKRIHFDRMDLVGESLALRGRGSVGFGGDVALDFYSRPPRPRRPSLPLIGALVNGATQWVRVRVDGTIDDPRPEVRSSIKPDESLQQFLNAFNVAPGMMPGLTVPRAFPFANNPLNLGSGAFQ